MRQTYLDAIRSFEGFTPRASFDYQQYSNGYGTRARHAGEQIDRAEADRRFRDEIFAARAAVAKFAPGLDEGTAAALTSLTFNAGSGWMRSGLGQAVKAGDLDAARGIFKQYVHAGGEVLPGLVKRRAAEAAWFGQGVSERATAVADKAEVARESPVSVADVAPAAPVVRLSAPERGTVRTDLALHAPSLESTIARVLLMLAERQTLTLPTARDATETARRRSDAGRHPGLSAQLKIA